MAVGSDEDGITAHGTRWRCGSIVRVVETSVVVAAGHELEGVAVKMEGMPRNGQ